MSDTATRKKPASAKTGAASAAKKPASAKGTSTGSKSASSTTKKKPAASGSTGASAKSASAKSSSGRKPAKKAPAVQDNPLGMRTAPAPAAPVKKTASGPKRVSAAKKPAARKKAPDTDAYDALLIGAERSIQSKQRRRALADEFDAPATAAKPSKKHSQKAKHDDDFDMPVKRRSSGGNSGKKNGGGFLTFVLTALLALGVLVVCLQFYNYSNFNTMRNAVEGENFFAGTAVDGIDVSQMSMEDAIAYWENNIEPTYSGRTVTLSDGRSITAAELGYSSNYRSVITDAWTSQTTGRLKDRYAALKRYSISGAGYHVVRTLYTDEAVDSYVAGVAEATDVEMSEPTITGFDFDTLGFTFGPGVQGKKLDRAQLSTDIKSTLDNGGGNVQLSIAITEPTVSVDEMQNLYGLRAYAVTNASSSTTNRLTNIELALNSINGLLIKPGETFSFNDVVGKRTADKGYKVATAYNAGEITEERGGGICQVSTTLFNAVVKAGLTVTERHPHSLPVSYVDKGKDAAVSWGYQDLKFTNDTDEPVYIVAYLDSDKRVRIGVFGRMPEDGSYITIEAELTEVVKFETVYQYNAFLLPGTQSELQEGRNTYKAVAYKLYWSESGELLDKEVLCYSTYKGRNCIIEYGP